MPEKIASDYTKHDPRGWCGDPKRGAALGRNAHHATDPLTWKGTLYVSRVPIDSGGYDPNGTYFGTGNPIFWIRDEAYEVDYTTRAPTRAVAVLEVESRYPRASFARKLTQAERERGVAQMRKYASQ